MSIQLDIENLYEWNTAKLWEVFSQLYFEGLVPEQAYFEVKFGCTIDFDIMYITNEWFEVFPSSKRMKMYGHGKLHLKDFDNEVQLRKNVMRDQISKEIDNSDIIEGRVIS